MKMRNVGNLVLAIVTICVGCWALYEWLRPKAIECHVWGVQWNILCSEQ